MDSQSPYQHSVDLPDFEYLKKLDEPITGDGMTLMSAGENSYATHFSIYEPSSQSHTMFSNVDYPGPTLSDFAICYSRPSSDGFSFSPFSDSSTTTEGLSSPDLEPFMNAITPSIVQDMALLTTTSPPLSDDQELLQYVCLAEISPQLSPPPPLFTELADELVQVDDGIQSLDVSAEGSDSSDSDSLAYVGTLRADSPAGRSIETPLTLDSSIPPVQLTTDESPTVSTCKSSAAPPPATSLVDEVPPSSLHSPKPTSQRRKLGRKPEPKLPKSPAVVQLPRRRSSPSSALTKPPSVSSRATCEGSPRQHPRGGETKEAVLSTLGKRKNASLATRDDSDFEPDDESEHTTGDDESSEDEDYRPTCAFKRPRTALRLKVPSASRRASRGQKSISSSKKRLVCDQCHGSFSRQGDLDRHHETTQCGSGAKRVFVCHVPRCHAQMKRKDAMKRHYKAKHPQVAYTPKIEWTGVTSLSP